MKHFSQPGAVSLDGSASQTIPASAAPLRSQLSRENRKIEGRVVRIPEPRWPQTGSSSMLRLLYRDNELRHVYVRRRWQGLDE